MWVVACAILDELAVLSGALRDAVAFQQLAELRSPCLSLANLLAEPAERAALSAALWHWQDVLSGEDIASLRHHDILICFDVRHLRNLHHHFRLIGD